MTQREQELYQERLKKADQLRKAGIDPYPAKSKRTHEISGIIKDFTQLEKVSEEITAAGRIRGIRGHGKLVFADLEDASGRLQVLFKADAIDSKVLPFVELLDIGDFISATGTLFVTKAGEKTLQVFTFKVLTKSLRALPEKYHGLQDIETKLRKRYLDLLANPEVRMLFQKKNQFWKTIRDFMENENFLEVETPVLEQVPGGAEAEPFVTHHNALDADFYLRISLELPLKRLLVGGFEKVFEIGRIFRNEGISAEHLQDYTQMEFYWAYADYEMLKDFIQKLYRKVIAETCGKLEVTNDNTAVDWGKPWQEYDYYKLFKKYVGLDLEKTSEEELLLAAKKQGIKPEKFTRKGRLIDQLYKKLVRPNLVKPGFLTDPPVEVEPLAKRHPKHIGKVQRLQVVAWGTELGKGFSELNDPVDQKSRFEEQTALRKAGDKEAQMLDSDFIEALEYGMPPAAGFGLSERLFALLMDKPVRETVIFPAMRKESDK